jgi:excisionase family DNA binding protein
MQDNNFPEVMTVKQAAEFLQVSPQTINRMIKDKKLKASKVGDIWRIQKADIVEYLNQHSNQ